MSMQQVAEYLGISRFTVSRWINGGDPDFPKPSRVGRLLRWRHTDVDRWLDSTRTCELPTEPPSPRRAREVRL